MIYKPLPRLTCFAFSNCTEVRYKFLKTSSPYCILTAWRFRAWPWAGLQNLSNFLIIPRCYIFLVQIKKARRIKHDAYSNLLNEVVSVQTLNISCQTYLAFLMSFNSYSSPKSLASVVSVAFNLTVVATCFLMEIFLTLISTALNISTSIFFLSYCLWQKPHVTDRKKGVAASSLFSESSQPNLRQQES